MEEFTFEMYGHTYTVRTKDGKIVSVWCHSRYSGPIEYLDELQKRVDSLIADNE